MEKSTPKAERKLPGVTGNFRPNRPPGDWASFKLPSCEADEIHSAAERCIACRACMQACTMLPAYCENPKLLLESWSESGQFTEDLPYACMLCSYCEAVCPQKISFKNFCMAMRKDVAAFYGHKVPKKFKVSGAHFHQHFRLHDRVLRQSYCDGDTLFFPGCSLLSDSPELVGKIYEALRERIPDIGLSMACCGKPTKFLGEEQAYEAFSDKLYRLFQDLGVKRIITACQNCLMAFRAHQDWDIQIDSLYTYLAAEGVGRERAPAAETQPDKLVIHDPCPIRYEADVQAAARSLLAQAGVEAKELRLNKRLTSCCGSGGMLCGCRPDLAAPYHKKRADQAKDAVIVTYCRECVDAMRRSGHEAVHILDLLFADGFKANLAVGKPGLKKLWNRKRAADLWRAQRRKTAAKRVAKL